VSALAGIFAHLLLSGALSGAADGQQGEADAAAVQLAAAAPCDAVWTGLVVEAGTAEVIPGALVVVRQGRAAPIYARSGADGRVAVARLCAGEAAVSVTKAEHSAARLTISIEGARTESVIALEALHDHHSHRVIVIHDETPTSVAASESLSGAELARTRGQGLADTLAGISGVTTLRGSAGGMGKPIIRGQFGRRNLIMVDGVRHEGQDWGIDHAPEVDPYGADRITVIKGAGTTRFGAKAIGGVVLLEPRPLPRQPSLRAELGTVGASNPLGGGGSARIDYAPLKGRGLALRVEGNMARHRATMTPEYALDNTGLATWNAGAQVGYASEAIDFGVGYRVMRARGGICTCLRISTPEEFMRGLARGRPAGVEAYRADFEIERAKQEIWHHMALARARVSLGGAGEIHGLYSFQFNQREEFEVVRQSVSGPQLSFGLATHAGELRFEHRKVEVGQGALVGTLGGTVSHQRNTFRSAATLIPDYYQKSWALYDVERLVFERVELEVGARYEGMARVAELRERDYLGQLAGGRLDPRACVASGAGGVCSHGFHTLSGTAGLLARPSKRLAGLTWRTHAHSSARIPSIDEQFMNGAAPSFPILGLGDSRIGVERSWGGEMALAYDGDWLHAEVAAFSTYVDDYIYFVPQQQEGQCAPLSCTARGPLPVFAFTRIDALFGGGEARVQLKAPRLPLAIMGDAAWVRGQDLSASAPLALLPADRYTLAGRYLLTDSKGSARGYVEINGTAVARQRRFQAALDFAPPPPAYVLLGAGAGVEWMAGSELFRLSLVGTNLLNQRYRDFTSLLRYFADEPGWGVQLRFAVDFDVALEEKAKRRAS
jgi:iron complex outermembrane receptor protein